MTVDLFYKNTLNGIANNSVVSPISQGHPNRPAISFELSLQWFVVIPRHLHYNLKTMPLDLLLPIEEFRSHLPGRFRQASLGSPGNFNPFYHLKKVYVIMTYKSRRRSIAHLLPR